MSNASLVFLPWVRQGAAAAIRTTDTLATGQSAVATIEPTLTLNGEAVTGIPVSLRGPQDVIGIDANQIVRTDPRPGTTDFEPNCFPSIEFDRPDFPWLFTPLKANASGQLRPWLCLVVLPKQAGITLTSTPDRSATTLRIASPADPALELPRLDDSWAWAHAQVAADASADQLAAPDAGTQQLIAGALNGVPEASLSRLVCPRFLAPGTDYVACVVPTFEVTRRAALGLPPVATLEPAWTSQSTDVLLPVFYHWEFRTGQAGDFEALVRRLKPTVPAGLGVRSIDISRSGIPVSGASLVEMEGALAPIAPAGTTDVYPVPPAFKEALASLINAPGQAEALAPGADPLLAPPMYGRWHAAATTVSPSDATWLAELNLDPRWRVAAALGTRVVQEHQEALMTSAWEQAAELSAVNQRLRQLQLSMAANEALYRRHFTALDEEAMLRIAAPAFGRLQNASGTTALLAQSPGTLLGAQAESALPIAANRTAMRRIGRQRGPLTRRVVAQNVTRSTTWVEVLNGTVTESAETAPPAPPPLEFAVLPPATAFTQRIEDDQSFFGAFLVAPENAPLVPPGPAILRPTPTEVPDHFRTAAREHLQRIFPVRPVTAPSTPPPLQDVKPKTLFQMHPRLAIPALAGAIVTTGDRVLAPTAPGVDAVGAETVMAAPTFPHPMYEALRDLSQDFLLPGLERVEPDTVLGLQTNRRFVEAYMVGLNHEMGRELLWRGYATDQRGTYFDRFWGRADGASAPTDIADLHTWGTRALGSDVRAPARDDQFVLLLRSSLLRRYPNAVVYLTPALDPGTGALVPDVSPESEKPPTFSGSMSPDVSFFGFPVPTATAIGGGTNGLGYYVVIQEHPTEPRFGIDANTLVGSATHAVVGSIPATGLTWGANAAEMAGSTRRLPTRIAIHASRLITPA